MGKFKNYWVGLVLVTVAFFGSSCDNNDEIVVDPNASFDAVLDVKESAAPTLAAPTNVDVTVNANTASTIKAKVSFTTTSKDMARLYITQNIKGAGETLYVPTEKVDTKADGAIDLSKLNSKNFEFQFALPVTAGVGVGTVVYKFWTTTGNGDPRDASQKLALGAGTITLKYGAATNPAATEALVKSFSAKILAAPSSVGTSLTFISLIDGVTYKINDGAEKARYWDFGYYYSATSAAASFASTSTYKTSFLNLKGEVVVDVPTIAGTTELNSAFFALSTKTSDNFTAVTKAGDLASIVKPANQKINNLKDGDIIEFVDNYGKKGLIKVVQVFKGASGNGYDADGYIKIDIKVQP